MSVLFRNIPTRNEDGSWMYTVFSTKDDFRKFVEGLFIGKRPGLYDFDETCHYFNEHARNFMKKGMFCDTPKLSMDYIDYWDSEREKCKKGVIIHGKNGKVWYLPRYFYHWLNFLQIYNTEHDRFEFPGLRDVQYHMALYEMCAELNGKHCAIVKKRQMASEQPHSEPVLGEYGWTTMGDIKTGDKLWNPDGTLTTILHKSNNGLSDIYEFEFIDGRKTRCGIEHNWEVFDKSAQKIKVLNTRQLLETGLQKSSIIVSGKKCNNFRYYIKNTEPIKFNQSKSFIIPPYVLGAILGDGSISQSVYLCGKDEEIFTRVIKDMGSDYEFSERKNMRSILKYKNRFSKDNFDKYDNGKYGANPLLRELENLNIKVNDKGVKFIPDSYKHASIEDRIALIQGLMDTDGFINSNGNDIHFTNTNKRLVDDFTYIVRSLGIKASICEKKHNRYKGGTFYRVRLSGNIKIDIFGLSRKRIRFEKRKEKKSFNLIPIISIAKLSYREESSCIVVDNPNHLYITKDFIVTHNSYFHIARIYNKYIFDEGFTAVIGASDKKYINNTKGCWKFLNQYYNFTSKHTAWAHVNSPNRVYEWQQQAEEKTPDGRRIDTGTHATITGVSFDQDPVGGVGGACKEMFYEEGGVAPTADQTFGFMKSAMRQGTTVTGIFIIAGSVGQLDQCEPIKNFLKKPDAYDIYAVESDLLDDNGTVGRTALFIPEQWSLTGEGELNFTDQFGNSRVENALIYLNREYARLKVMMQPNDYQLEISQRPRNIDEAFAMRTQSIFPVQHTSSQLRRIEENEYALEYVDLIRNEKNKIETIKCDRRPITEFPCPMDMADKRGVCVMHEPPIPGAPPGTYIATFDPVETGATTTSASLASLTIYMLDVEVITEVESDRPIVSKDPFRDVVDEWGPIRRPQRQTDEPVTRPRTISHLEGGKEVFFWCGRYDDPDETNEHVSRALELYNARCMCEKNKPGFISYMRSKKRHKYLALGKEMTFDKDLDIATTSREPYGVGMTPKLKKVLLSYAVDSLSEVIFEEFDKDGNIIGIHYGVEKIRDIMLLKEMQQYQEGINVDRIISYIILRGWIKSIQASGLIRRKKIEAVNNTSNKFEKVVLFKGSNDQLFKNIGRVDNGQMIKNHRNPFKNIR